MLNAYFYYVATYTVKPEPEKKITGGNFSIVERVRGTENLAGMWEKTVTVHACTSKKDAQKLTDYWNECFKNNGTYAFA